MGPEDDLQSSDRMVLKTLEIAAALGNPPLFVENPYTGQLKNRGTIPFPMRVLDYCVYGMPYRKRTAVWTNTDWEPARRLCKRDCWASDGKRHFAIAQHGPPGPCFTQHQLYRIAPELCDEIAAYCNALVGDAEDARCSPVSGALTSQGSLDSRKLEMFGCLQGWPAATFGGFCGSP